MTASALHVVFAEEDTLFRLMEMGLRRAITPAGEKTLRYFFGPEFSAPLERLTTMADRLGLPRDIAITFCDDDATLDQALPTADVVVLESARLPGARVRACAPRARLIQQFGRAVDNIDIETADRLAIPVANLIRLSSLSCTDHITALIFALSRRLIDAHQAVMRQRDPALPAAFSDAPARNKFNWSGLRGFRILAHSTVGFIGMGENSGFVARRLRDMGCRVLYFKRTPLSPAAEAGYGGITFAPLDELLARSDFVSLHLPYNEQTEKFADAGLFAKMRPGAYIINSSRGGILDEVALHAALASGHLGGAALDVYRHEPIPANSPLLELDNILWTPHISGGEPEYMIVEAEDVLTNIARAWRGEPPAGLVAGGARWEQPG